MTPRPEETDILKGYLYLSATWLKEHPTFRLSCPMQPRIVRPNPLTMQSVANVMRGPIVYCVEDVDHPWEQHHFKVLQKIPGQTISAKSESRKRSLIPRLH